MADVFLSYAREDRATAERVADALQRHGYSVWWDRHLPAGKRFDEVIVESLASAWSGLATATLECGQRTGGDAFVVLT